MKWFASPLVSNEGNSEKGSNEGRMKSLQRGESCPGWDVQSWKGRGEAFPEGESLWRVQRSPGMCTWECGWAGVRGEKAGRVPWLAPNYKHISPFPALGGIWAEESEVFLGHLCLSGKLGKRMYGVEEDWTVSCLTLHLGDAHAVRQACRPC